MAKKSKRCSHVKRTIMRRVLVMVILFGVINTVVACECLPLTFEQEIQSATSILRGRVTAINHYTFDIEIIETWKGGFATKTFQLVQGMTSCERRVFELDKEYLFYLRGTSVWNCSRTSEFELTKDLALLELKFKNIDGTKIGASSKWRETVITPADSAGLTSFLQKFTKAIEAKNREEVRAMSLRVVRCPMCKGVVPFEYQTPIDTLINQLFEGVFSRLLKATTNQSPLLVANAYDDWTDWPELTLEYEVQGSQVLYLMFFTTWKKDEYQEGHEGEQMAFQIMKLKDGFKFLGLESVH